MDWRLVRCGELLLSLDFLSCCPPLFSMPYRQIEGFARALDRLVPRISPIDYSWVRRLGLLT